MFSHLDPSIEVPNLSVFQTLQWQIKKTNLNGLISNLGLMNLCSGSLLQLQLSEAPIECKGHLNTSFRTQFDWVASSASLFAKPNSHHSTPTVPPWYPSLHLFRITLLEKKSMKTQRLTRRDNLNKTKAQNTSLSFYGAWHKNVFEFQTGNLITHQSDQIQATRSAYYSVKYHEESQLQ